MLFTLPHDPLPRRYKNITWCLNSEIVVQIIWKITKSKLSKPPDCSRLSGFKIQIMWPTICLLHSRRASLRCSS